MSDVTRIYPESKTGLINWIEENFHEIDEFIIQFTLKDHTTMMVYDTYSYLNALGMLEIAKDTVHVLSHEDSFKPKKRDDEHG